MVKNWRIPWDVGIAGKVPAFSAKPADPFLFWADISRTLWADINRALVRNTRKSLISQDVLRGLGPGHPRLNKAGLRKTWVAGASPGLFDWEDRMSIWRWFLCLFSEHARTTADEDREPRRLAEPDRRRLLDEAARQAEWLRLPPGGASPG
jgi:hypothetical protein